jgi:midasin
VPAERLHPLLLAYLRLLTADPHIAGRSDWPNGSLHVLRTQHPDMGVRLLAIQILAVQRGWSEEKRMQMEKDWIGDMVEVDAVVMYGYEVVKLDIGFELRAKSVDGWMLPVLESRRIAKRELQVDDRS